MKSYRKAIAYESEFIPKGRDSLDREGRAVAEIISYIYQEEVSQVVEDIMWAAEHPCKRLPRA